VISSKTFIAFTKFGIVGGISFLVDMSVYYGISQFFPTYFAKAAGIVVATLVNYKLNKYWTWETKKSEIGDNSRNETLKKYLMLYALSGGINVGTNEIMLATLPNWEMLLPIQWVG
jgi:putative flippase GtrA